MPAIHLTSDSFREEIIENKKTALVDFSATWCGPCQAVAPVIDELSDELTDVIVAKLDIDESIDIARKYFVLSVPTIVAFRDGAEIGRAVGLQSKDEYSALLSK